MKPTKEQQQAIDRTECNLIVSAGAGSGKTSTMITRAVQLVLERRVPVNRITMLTYTNDAAAEMKSRFRTRLMEALPTAKTTEERERLMDQIEMLAFADISTIHSFCYKIVREFFERVPISPTVSILDEESAASLRDKAFAQLLREQEGKEEFDRMRIAVGMRQDDNLRRMVTELYDHMTNQPNRKEWLDGMVNIYFADMEEAPVVQHFVKQIVRSARTECAALRELFAISTKTKDKTLISTLLDKYQGFENCATLADLYKAAEPLAITFAIKPQGAERPEEIVNHKEILAHQIKGPMATVTALGSYDRLRFMHKEIAPFIRLLADLVLRFEAIYEKLKQELSVVDFSDLEHYTLRILKDDALAEELRARRDYMFVDEYQDTNYVQAAIISRITPPDRLFVVGDCKQCIYRFRQAEPQIFMDTREQLSATGNAISFLDNFRSDRQILHFVNRVFDSLMSKEFGGMDYTQTEAFRLRDDAPDCGPKVVQMQILPAIQKAKAEEQSGVYDVFTHSGVSKDEAKAEADAILAYIRAHLGQEVEIMGKRKKLTYSDFAILFHKRSDYASSILQHLTEAGIPLSLGKFVADVGERDLQLLLQYVFLLDNYRQDYPLLSVLHSPFASFSNQDLADIRIHRHKVPFWQVFQEYAELDNPLAARVRNFLSAFDRYRQAASFTPIGELLTHILYDSGYIDHVLTQEDGEARVLTVKNFIAELGKHSFATHLSSVAAHYRKRGLDKLNSAEFASSEGVLVRTIHASKGLEYPVVIMAACHEGLTENGRNAVYTEKNWGIATHYYDHAAHSMHNTALMELIKMDKTRKEQEDLLRLMYVAMTRARNYLFITGARVKDVVLPEAGKNFMSWLLYAIKKDPTLASHLVDMQAEDTPQNADALQGENPAEGSERADSPEDDLQTEKPADDRVQMEQMADVLDMPYPYPQDLLLRRKYTVTALNAQQTEGEPMLPSILPVEDVPLQGTCYHTVLQYIDYELTTEAEVEQAICDMRKQRILPSDEIEVDPQKILRCLSLPIMQLAATSQIRREQRFLIRIPAVEIGFDSTAPVLIQGTIDLVIDDGEHLYVVDFKHSKRSADSLIEAYRLQLQLYARAVSESTGRAVDAAYIVELSRAQCIECPLNP